MVEKYSLAAERGRSMLSHESFKKKNHPGKNRSKLPETFTHSKMCYSRFSKISDKNLTLRATRKCKERTFKLIIGNIHFLYV